ncbi:hypothetical protein C8F01DRAFT_1163421 [Mycena amicta]|nr:hypothetical protein C8F01DRAFT_1163421 [Mycena amicta]
MPYLPTTTPTASSPALIAVGALGLFVIGFALVQLVSSVIKRKLDKRSPIADIEIAGSKAFSFVDVKQRAPPTPAQILTSAALQLRAVEARVHQETASRLLHLEIAQPEKGFEVPVVKRRLNCETVHLRVSALKGDSVPRVTCRQSSLARRQPLQRSPLREVAFSSLLDISTEPAVVAEPKLPVSEPQPAAALPDLPLARLNGTPLQRKLLQAIIDDDDSYDSPSDYDTDSDHDIVQLVRPVSIAKKVDDHEAIRRRSRVLMVNSPAFPPLSRKDRLRSRPQRKALSSNKSPKRVVDKENQPFSAAVTQQSRRVFLL